jgi:chaperone modulatory protein CbpM
MEKEEMISAHEFCVHHDVDLSFIYSLNESGLIEMITIEEKIFVPLSEINNLEKFVRLYYELDINLEGIETITYLLKRMNDMQQEITMLTDRLRLYENE